MYEECNISTFTNFGIWGTILINYWLFHSIMSSNMSYQSSHLNNGRTGPQKHILLIFGKVHEIIKWEKIWSVVIGRQNCVVHETIELTPHYAFLSPSDQFRDEDKIKHFTNLFFLYTKPLFFCLKRHVHVLSLLGILIII